MTVLANIYMKLSVIEREITGIGMSIASSNDNGNEMELASINMNIASSNANGNDNNCCIPCTFPENKCCMECKDVSTPREHELLMAAMEGLTLHIMDKHGSKEPNKNIFLKNRAWAGNSHIGNRDKQAQYYYDFVKSLDLGFDTSTTRHVCEVGMNGGHSAFIMLSALSANGKDKDAKLTMFDLGEWSYSKDVAAYLKAVFPRRFEVFYGHSTKTLPDWTSKNENNKCDVFSVDGDHRYEGAKRDILNAAKASRKGGMIILDDMDTGSGSRKAFDEALAEGIIGNPKCVYTKQFVGYDDRYNTTGNAREMKLYWCTAHFLR